MFFNRFGLQSKIIIILSVAVVSVATVSTYLAMLLTRQPVEEAIYRKVLSQALATAHQIDAQEFSNSNDLLARLREVQRDFKGVDQCDVRAHDPAHTLVASTDPSGPHLELDATSGIEHYNEFESAGEDQLTIETPDARDWIVSTPLRDREGRTIGCLQLRVSKKTSNVIIDGLVWRNLILMLASLVAVMLAVHVFFLYNVRRPVKEMVEVMETAEGGGLQVRAHCEDEGKARDEIAQLACHLNRMLSRMENFNAELAGKVNQATGELARRNEELTRINEELFDTQRTLARSERLAVAGQLAASLAHEIGTPLNSISGHVQLMARRKTGDKTMDRRLQIIDGQIENIVRSVKQLLSWTRKFELRPAMIDVRHVIEEVVLLSSPALDLRKIRVRTDLPLRAPEIYADAGYLQQVFLNLINNSIDAMPKGGRIEIRVTVPPGSTDRNEAGRGEPSAVTVEVEDSGEGIPPETLKHIFDPMFTTKRMGTGAGLGLAICKQIVQQHGGSIQVSSQMHQGTRFVITLPVDVRVREQTPAAVLSQAS